MSMLTLNGTVQNVFAKPESKDRETGEIRPATVNAQILAENILESGEKRLENRYYSAHESPTIHSNMKGRKHVQL